MKKWSLILLLGLLSCNPEAKNLRQTQEYLFKHPEFSSGYCAEQFPQKADSVIVKTDTVTEVIINDPTLEVVDTAYFDTSNCKPITILKTKTITIRKDSIIYRENRAEQERLQLGLLECQKLNVALIEKNTKIENDLTSWKGKAKKRWMWLALLIGGAAAFTAFKVFKTVKGV